MAYVRGKRTLRVFVELSVCEGDQTDTPLGGLIDDAILALGQHVTHSGALSQEGVVASVKFHRSDGKPTVHARVHYINEYVPTETLNLFTETKPLEDLCV